MLPQILPKDDLVLAVTLPTETRLELEDLKAPSWSSWSRGHRAAHRYASCRVAALGNADGRLGARVGLELFRLIT